MSEPVIPRLPLSQYKAVANKVAGADAVALYNNNIVARFARDYNAAHEKELARYGMGIGRHIVINLIMLHQANGITPAELAAMLGITRGAMTGLLDGLEREGLIARDKHPDDRRMVRLVLTRKGQNKIDEYYPAHAKTLSRSMNVLTKREQSELVRLLDKLATGFRQLNGQTAAASPRKKASDKSASR